MSVDRPVDSENRMAFPSGVAIKDSLLGHLEFGLRHEGPARDSLRGDVEPIVTRSPVLAGPPGASMLAGSSARDARPHCTRGSPNPKTPMPLHPVLQTLTQGLNRRLGSQLRGLWLVGSRARGDARETSDDDILVLVDEKTPDVRDRILDLQVEILDRHEAVAATIVRTDHEWRGSQGYPLVRNIAREAVRL